MVGHRLLLAASLLALVFAGCFGSTSNGGGNETLDPVAPAEPPAPTPPPPASPPAFLPPAANITEVGLVAGGRVGDMAITWRVVGASAYAHSFIEYGIDNATERSLDQLGPGTFRIVLSDLVENATYVYRLVLLDGSWAVRLDPGFFRVWYNGSREDPQAGLADISWTPAQDGFRVSWRVTGKDADAKTYVVYSASGVPALRTPSQEGVGLHNVVLTDLRDDRQYSFHVVLLSAGTTIASEPHLLKGQNIAPPPPPGPTPIFPPQQPPSSACRFTSISSDPDADLPISVNTRASVQADGDIQVDTRVDGDAFPQEAEQTVEWGPAFASIVTPSIQSAGTASYAIPFPGDGQYQMRVCANEEAGEWDVSPTVWVMLGDTPASDVPGVVWRVVQNVNHCFEVNVNGGFGPTPTVVLEFGVTDMYGSVVTASTPLSTLCMGAGDWYYRIMVTGNGQALASQGMRVLAQGTFEIEVGPDGDFVDPASAAPANRPLMFGLKNGDDIAHALKVVQTPLHIGRTAAGVTAYVEPHRFTPTTGSIYPQLAAGTYTVNCLIHAGMTTTLQVA